MLGCYKILLFCDFEDVIPLWKEDNVGVTKIFVIETNFIIDFIIEFGRILTEIM
jgi:hypothetical protein